MNLNNIEGVRELTLKECEEINGGGWGSIVWKVCKAVGKEVAKTALFNYICSFFS